jgi:hypothetical protein
MQNNSTFGELLDEVGDSVKKCGLKKGETHV